MQLPGDRWKSIVLILACIFLGSGCSRKVPVEPIRVGHIAPQSGSLKAVGIEARQGILLAVEEANKEEDKVLGRRVEVDHADTRGDRDAVRAVLVRLLSVNKVAALLGGSEVADLEDAGSLTRSHKTPCILSSGRVAKPIGDYLYYTGLVPQWHGQVLARFASQELKKTKVAVLSDGSSRDDLVEAFAKELPKDGILGRWTYKNSETLKTATAELRARRPEAILFAGPVGDLVSLTPAATDPPVPILFAGDEDGVQALQHIPEQTPLYLATAFVADAEGAAPRAFTEKYRQRFGSEPGAPAALAYDDARLLFEAIRRANSVEGAKVNETLSTMSFDGLFGQLAFDPHHVVSRPAFLVRIVNGQAKTVKRYEPEKKDDKMTR